MSGATSSDLTVGFKWATEMSTGFSTSSTTRNGWFHLDPTQLTFTSTSSGNLAVGNFISSNDATDAFAPRDSFMVYVGAPTGATFKASDGQTYPTDPLRKWFSETIQAVDGYYLQLLSAAGANGSGAGGAAETESFVIPNAALTDILANGNNKVRLVFRVKTNRGFDDDVLFGEAYGSGKKGAAQVDDVTYSHTGGSSPANWGTFELAGSIDNTQDALDAWRSTGKPPFASGHVENIVAAGLAYDDLCGNLLSTTRQCDVSGNIVTFGWHDIAGHPHGNQAPGTADNEFHQTITSPTIQFATPVSGDNAQGLDSDDVVALEDFYVDMDLYSGTMDPGVYGNYWRTFVQSYPAADRFGNASWTGINPVPYIIFSGPDPQCFQDFIDHPVQAFGSIETSNASGIPDSIRIGVQLWQRCFRTPAAQCGTTNGSYYDNLGLVAIDGLPSEMSLDIWDLFNDTFPSNETVTPGIKADFDTTAAVIKIGRAIGSDFVTGQRYPTPGDSVVVTTSPLPGQEVYMIFRIFPGAGNYVTNGRPDLDGNFNLRKVPTNAAPIVSGDLTNFWSNYIANNGVHGTPGGHVAAAGRGAWNPNVWNSARCDTAETNLFPNGGVPGATPNAVVPVPSDFATNYHDSDPRGSAAQLGISTTRCFLTNVGGPLPDVTCNGTVPAWVGLSGVANAATGWDGQVFTTEYTKILPDGLLTPGAHVQYFFARYNAGAGSGASPQAMVPDTTTVFPQNSESSTDGHRWQQFSVLPDVWKSADHKHPFTGLFGDGLACMLVVDNNDRRGNERVWVSIADSIGATSAIKRGSHNGWSAGGNTAQGVGIGVNDPSTFVARHYGQPGTTWDLYNVKASESLGTGAGHIGVRLAPRDPGNTQLFGATAADFPGKSSRMGPTPDMLEAYYQIMFLMTGDLNSDVLSPVGQRTADDIGLIDGFLSSGSSAASADRGFYAVGDGLVEFLIGETVS